MQRTCLALLLGLFLSFIPNLGCAQNTGLVTWKDIAQLPAPAPGQCISYSSDSLQFGELRLPAGAGPFPVVVLIHGGCWLSEYNAQYMAHIGAALTKAGYATWNLEFRRVGNAGGGWPGTFLDVAQGTDYVRQLAKTYPILPKKVVVLGHSAGGHLALWLAARRRLPRNSPLYSKNPLKLRGIVSLAGIPDLAAYSTASGSCNAAVAKLLGGLPTDVPERYATAAPSQLLPLRVPQRLIQGNQDPIVPVSQAQDFATLAQAKGDDARVVLLPNAGHFDLVYPPSPVWPTIEKAVQELLGSPREHEQ
ncbi:alpha/beta hydrolase family protein [Hymenobacter cavernae]|uniref:BD-FAE-like domain-containing protein n=1 Tax=Hymenobacter cavernae TaxID=2044852 RepID=A0ABQ1TFU2_9BACT|nr:alpha/beta hydrolase [Hymenobacter cavernae]GGE94095.1 hypothetical protein GCM10011383_01010 [Hymenobacter cavernae]